MSTALQTAGVRPTSRRLYRLFAAYSLWHLWQHFRAVRVLHAERLPLTEDPLILYFNHASWWDPLVCVRLQRRLLPERNHYAPMDAAALRQYEFFSKIGIFPIDLNTPRGGTQFLRGAEAILHSGSVLWVTPQGEFVDVRRRPLVLKQGLGALLHRLPTATVIPVAMEYTFWDQRLPEALVSFGDPMYVRDGRATAAHAWTERLTAALTAAQDELASAAMARDASPFRTLMDGARGTAGIYGLWQRVRARVRGERFSPDHASRHRPVAGAER